MSRPGQDRYQQDPSRSPKAPKASSESQEIVTSGEASSQDGREIAELADPSTPVRLEETIQAAREYAEAARTPNTLRAYASDIGNFTTYCWVELGGVQVLPASPETVTLYITDMAREVSQGRGLKVSTVSRRLASISAWHKRSGFPSPTDERLIRETMKGIRRKKGSKQKQAAPLTVGVLKRVLGAIRVHHPKTGAAVPAALRDRALLLVGFAGSFRREEISALRVSDLEFFEGRGLVVEVRSSKTDAEGEGEVVGIPYGDHEETCPITAVERWLDYAGRSGEEHLFCRIDRHGNFKSGGISGDGINDLVKRRVLNAGLDVARYSGHSLRAGLPTSASEEKVGMEAWMPPHTRHKSVAVDMRYARSGVRSSLTTRPLRWDSDLLSRSKRHHLLPRFYLAGFCNPEVHERENHEQDRSRCRVWVHDKEPADGRVEVEPEAQVGLLRICLQNLRDHW